MKLFNRRIELNTFLKKGLPPIDDRFGVYFCCGRQGSGKSYIGVKIVLDQDKKIVNKVFTNMKSLKIPNYDIHYFNKIDEIYNNTEEYCIFYIDEISKKYDRNSRTDTQFYAWLNQCRKRKRIVILITQEWRELPMWIRRPAKYMIQTNRTIFSKFGIYKSIIGDAENMVFNKDEGEYECPPILYIYYKRNKYIANMYDTFEAVSTL